MLRVQITALKDLEVKKNKNSPKQRLLINLMRYLVISQCLRYKNQIKNKKIVVLMILLNIIKNLKDNNLKMKMVNKLLSSKLKILLS